MLHHFDAPYWANVGTEFATEAARVRAVSPPGVDVRLVNVEDGAPLPVDESGNWLIDPTRVTRYAVQFRGTGTGSIFLIGEE